jgi:tetratricopeptide (TPR) repeat protein
LGENHPDIIRSVHDMAELLNTKRKYNKAEIFYRQVLGMKYCALGEEHSDVAYSLNNLGCVLEKQNKYEDAEGLYRKAITMYQKVCVMYFIASL